jgi:hypothetical protein
MDRVAALVEILLDKNARIDERDDAAMDLGAYNDDRALSALLSIATDHTAEPVIMDVCGESIGEIWAERNFFDISLFKKMTPKAQFELYSYIAGYKPELIKNYSLDLNGLRKFGEN